MCIHFFGIPCIHTSGLSYTGPNTAKQMIQKSDHFCISTPPYDFPVQTA